MEAKTLAGIAAGIIVLSCAQNLRKKKNKLRRQRRWWMLSIHKSRGQFNGLILLADLQKEPSGKFMNFCRMSAEDFEIILNQIGPHILKQDINMRKAISIQERLVITLRFSATGNSFTSIGYLFKVSNQTISVIVPEVCKAINEALKDQIKIPKTQQEWMKIANGFQYYWNFPHCLVTIDGKHIVLQAPFNSESEYFNYKKSFSIVLMA
ncbi:uncharacterized protein LOC126750463 [Anthonomus grandis grandis]|uniref:uncharacterized protein LOC126750463 n=1 Tax=Anthonomus grandis grandis TaxID=2921223 RepID=UPI0021662339|nr:uncharacterized protein LOC126750463 [Anthonomus grandis grandis]